ncbi:hypothetical protein GCM10009815_24360 [Nocardioides marmoribigeumensis]
MAEVSTPDLDRARTFVLTHGRLLDRLRLLHLAGEVEADRVAAALDAYRNPDGGYGHALEPDIRSPHSETTSTLAALELLDHLGLHGTAQAEGALAWVGSVITEDGGVPFMRHESEGWPLAPWMATDDKGCHLTFGYVAQAARHGLTPAWLGRAQAWCDDRLDAPEGLGGYHLKYALKLLDACDDDPLCEGRIEALRHHVRADGSVPVSGGEDDEGLRPLVLSPEPDACSRRLFTDGQVAADLDALAAGQEADGGWTFDWAGWCPGQELEWRGALTVDALQTLRRHGR